MSKHKKAQTSSRSRRKNAKVWYGAVAGIVLAGVVFTYLGVSQESSSGAGQTSNEPAQASSYASSDSTLRNRLVLPAGPKTPRPATLSPNGFSDPEVSRSYQIAKDIPEVLENMPCYCGCYGSSGHRNNLDCFTDNHGET